VNKLQSWLLFLYKVPHEPSSYRVYVWRKLKRIGALLLHDSAWALPMSSRSLAQFQELAAEIAKLGGDSLLWEARLAVGIQDEALVGALLAQLEPAIDEVPAKGKCSSLAHL
jgi:Protein ChrB, N-terminal